MVKYEDLVHELVTLCRHCMNCRVFTTYSKETPNPYENPYCKSCNKILRDFNFKIIDPILPNVLNNLVCEYLFEDNKPRLKSHTYTIRKFIK